MVFLVGLAGLLSLSGGSSVARAEGSAEWGTEQQLQSDTELYVDIFDYTVEKVTWTGSNRLDVYDSTGTRVGTLSSGSSFTPTANGTYTLAIREPQESDWDIEVTNQTDPGYGRLWSYNWHFNTGHYEESYSFDGSVYARVPVNSTESAVIEMYAEGLSGYDWYLGANSIGVDGADGRSVLYSSSTTFDPEYRIYLNPPTDATYSYSAPTVTGGAFGAGALECNEVAPGVTTGEFTFTSSNDGTGRIICDLNGDGDFDQTSDDDLSLTSEVVAGDNTIEWDGTDNTGADVASGVYECIAVVTIGEFHYVALDVETSYEGFRLFEVDSALGRAGLSMFWNDADVQSLEVTMPSGDVGLESPGSSGLDSGAYTDATEANVNARSWGNFSSSSKGNNTYLDTYTYLASAESAVFEIEVVGATDDSDGDGLLDIDENCTHGTDSADTDTDDDGLGDGEEVSTVGTDPLDPDTDDGGALDGAEVEDGTDPFDPIDDDSDGDGLSDLEEEDLGTDPDVSDSDGDGLSDGDEVGTTGTDPLEGDTDGDGLSDGDEVNTTGTDPNASDTDGDGLTDGDEVNTHSTDPLVADTDGDTLSDGDEVNTHGTDPNSTDTDGDGLGDADEIGTTGTDPTDADSDDDGLGDADEVDTTGTDPNDADSDDDGLGDGDELNSTGTDPLVADTDGDSLSDGDEVNTHGTDPNNTDTDGDTLGDGDEVNTHGTDPAAADTDGDGLADGDEVNTNLTDPTNADTDGDGLDDGAEVNEQGTDPLDADTDDGGVSDGDEVEAGTDPLDGADDAPELGKYGGAGCSTSGQTAPAGAGLLLALGLLARRRRRA